MPHKRAAKHLNAQQQNKLLYYPLYFFSIATPLFELPQAYTIYVKHNAQNVSIYTWVFFLIDNVVWIVYGIRKKSKPLIISSILYLIIEAVIVAGIVKYS